jgi:hypothetical protein
MAFARAERPTFSSGKTCSEATVCTKSSARRNVGSKERQSAPKRRDLSVKDRKGFTFQRLGLAGVVSQKHLVVVHAGRKTAQAQIPGLPPLGCVVGFAGH